MTLIVCQHCGENMTVEDEAKVRAGHNASSSTPREWVLRDRGVEIHRCTGSIGDRMRTSWS